MNKYIGIDLGTSALKGILTDEELSIIKEASKSYPIYQKDSHSEQSPNDWFDALVEVVKELTSNIKDKENIVGISFSGQMHGLVVLDENDNVIRPCILWNDTRSSKETDYLNNSIGKEKLIEYTGNIAFAGFTAPKLLWMYNNEKKLFDNISKIMLPKDYLVYKLTNVFATDYSDAAGTLFLDVKNKVWSKHMLDICHINESKLPSLYESYDLVSKLTPIIAKELGLPNLNVYMGGADNAVAAIGTNAINDNDCNVSLGTSGTILISKDNFTMDSLHALHSFNHANGKYYQMGCILSAASCRSWWLTNIINTDDYYKDEQDMNNANTDGLYFLPYLVGERCPHNDTKIRGAFIGLSSTTTRKDMSKAILEGVLFAIKESLELANSKIDTITLCGGGAKSKLWRQMTADILNLNVKMLETEQGPSYGAAILAIKGYTKKEFSDFNKYFKYSTFINPINDNVIYYEKKYTKYKKIYPVLKVL